MRPPECRSRKGGKTHAKLSDSRHPQTGANARAEERNGMFPHALRRDVIVMLCLKAVALTLLYFLFFHDKPIVTPAAVQQQLIR
jgi:hypothetical protein